MFFTTPSLRGLFLRDMKYEDIIVGILNLKSYKQDDYYTQFGNFTGNQKGPLYIDTKHKTYYIVHDNYFAMKGTKVSFKEFLKAL